MIRQGDVLLVPAELPEEAIKLETKVLQESETSGHHHHFMDDAAVGVYQTREEPSEDLTITPDWGKYIVVKEPAELFHGKGFLRDPNQNGTGDHKALTINPGTYKVIITREYDWSTKSHKKVVD